VDRRKYLIEPFRTEGPVMKAQNGAFAGAAIGVVMLAGLLAEGQVDKTSRKRAETPPRDASGAAPAGPIEVQPPVQRVLASDIGTRVQIIGRLGYPLGELVTIRGAWIRPRGLPNQPVKDDTPCFSVTSVNGKRSETPVIFDFFSKAWGAEEIPPQEGPVWEVRGCESGGFRGTSREVREDALRGPNPPPPVAHPWWHYEFRFRSEFIYSSFKSLEETVFLGTVTRIDNVGGAADHRSRLGWVVTLKIDNVIQGRLPMEAFQLAIHSPSQEGVELGRQYRISVQRISTGYDYCGPHPWRRVPPDLLGPK
jgi:hypothetical protein